MTVWTNRQLTACRTAVARFRDDDGGALTVFSLVLFILMLAFAGVAIDFMRQEAARTRLQYTLDRAILAAADLDQTEDATKVVEDYFEKAGLEEYLVNVDPSTGLNYRIVKAESSANIPSFFLNMVGIDTLVAPAVGVAEERVRQVEISLVLDVSGSMGRNNRLYNLKVAAKEFVDTILAQSKDIDGTDMIHISVIPFSMQVTAGQDLLSYFNVTDEHSYSHCIDFDANDFKTAQITSTQTLQRTAHFDPWSYADRSYRTGASQFICKTEGSREILAYANNASALKSHIDSFFADGNTSMDLGAKWGAALLDPAARHVVTGMVAKGQTDTDFAGRPRDYTETDVLKVMVVMSDGENTTQYQMQGPYASGLSEVWRDPRNGDVSVYDPDRYWTNDKYYRVSENRWRSSPDGGSNAEQLTYPELWNLYSLDGHARYYRYPMYRRSNDFYFWDTGIRDSISSSTKNTRTSQICGAAKAKGVTIFTIGFEAPSVGDATLMDCATSEGHFFDVEGLEISEAFSAIASTINQLRLSQ